MGTTLRVVPTDRTTGDVMNYLHSDLGHRQRGDVLEVTLTRGANVRLMDSSNFNMYRRGEAHRYHGGLAKRSPVRIAIPTSGRRYAVVDMQGLRGSTRAGFKVIPSSALRPLPPIRDQHMPLSEIAENLASVGSAVEERDFDVFISHASEDKEAIVRPLAGC